MDKNQNTIFAIDIGNTNIHWCYIQESKVLGSYNRNKHTELSLLPWEEIKKQSFPVVIAGSLIHMNDAIKSIAQDYNINLTEITLERQNIIKNTYVTLGIDRVCNLACALNSFQNLKTQIVIFDFGTATTITSCNYDGNFLGGMITTGCEIELKAISSKTLSLPHVELAKEQKITKLNPVSRSTEDAILHGVIISQLAIIDFYLELFKKELNSEPKIVFTGGNAPTIIRFMEKKCDLFDPHLTIKGIYHCYQSILHPLKI